jgi:hypothetical protein
MTRLLLVFAVAALSACATQEPLQKAAELRQTHGYVVAAIPLVVDAQPVGVTLRSIPKGDRFHLEPAEGRTLARWVPAGSYEIAQMVGKDTRTFVPIQVTAGGSVDLGGLTWASVGTKQRVLLPLRHPELSERTALVIQKAREHLTSEAVEWNPPVAPAPQDIPPTVTNLGLIADLLMLGVENANQTPLRARLREKTDIGEFTSLHVSTAAPLVGDPAADGQGNLYIGSNFGQLRRRDVRGEWRSIDTGTIAPIASVHVQEQTILVGTLDGRLRASPDGGQTWTELHRFGDNEPVLSIQGRAGRFLVLTARVSGPLQGRSEIDRATVYEVHAQPLSRPQQIRSFEFPKIETFGLPTLRGVLVGRYYFVNRITALERLDLDGGTWKAMQIPHNISHLRVSSDGKVLTAYLASAAFSKLSASTDEGNTWTRVTMPLIPVHDVRMESLTSGAASRWEVGALSSSLQLVNYDAQDRTWPPAWTAPQAACLRTVRGTDGREQFCASRGGSIFRITPKGLVPEFLAD